MGARHVEVEIAREIAHLKFCRADALNTMTMGFFRELAEIVDDIDRHAKARVIVISSSGRHFSAGLDLSVLQDPASGLMGPNGEDVARHQERFIHTIAGLQNVFTRLESARMPVLAAIQGGCIGGGLDLTAACDIRYASADAFFIIQEIHLAVIADLGTYPRLCHLMPAGLVRELGYTGRRLGAAEAKEVGFVNKVFANQDEMLAAVMGVAREIAAKSPVAVAGSKAAMNYAREHSIADGLAHVALLQGVLHHGPDQVAAGAAQRAKTVAQFDNLKPKTSF